MQALLSRAVEEQVSEQRQAAGALVELRTTLAELEDSIRGAASNDAVERLDSTVSTVVADLRTSTTLLSQRLEGLGQRVDAIVTDTTAPIEQSAVRLSALAAEVSAQAETVGRMRVALEAMGAFPEAMAALQRDVAGLHDRVAPLADVQAAVSDLGTRTYAVLEALRPQLGALEAKLAALGNLPAASRLRDEVVDALGPRLERLQQAAERPVVGPEVLRSGLGDLRAAVVAAVGEATEPLGTGLFALETRLGQLEVRLGALDDRVATRPAEPAGLADVQERLEELDGLRAQLDAVAAGVTALRSATAGSQVQAALETLSGDVAALAEVAARPGLPSLDELSAHVSQRVADRLVEVLAPRISDVVLTRVSAALVTQLGEALAPRLRAETDTVLRSLSAESETRILAHVDEAVLALAEALLRRKGVRRPAPSAAPVASPSSALTEAPAPQEPVHDILERLAADEPLVEQAAPKVSSALSAVLEAMGDVEFPEIPGPLSTLEEAAPSRPAVTTGLAPAPARPAAAAAKAPEKTPEKAPAKAAAKAPSKTPAKAAEKAPVKAAKAPAKAAAAKKAPPRARPRPRPFLDPSPDHAHEVTPVRKGAATAPAAPALPVVTPSPSAAPAPPPAAPTAPAAPAPPPWAGPAAVPPPPAPAKRKAWWRPGG
jgi:hypothetical protein